MTDSDASERAAAGDDAAAIARVLAGDREAFGLLVARYGRRVHDLARRMLRDAHEAEDATQQAFLNAYRALPRYDDRRPFRHWLLRITSNLCRNRIAERHRRPMPAGAPGQDDDDGRGPVLDPEAPPVADAFGDGPEAAVDPARVRAAIEALAPPYRLTVVLRYVQGLPLEEIVEITGQPMGTVKTHLFRARAALARILVPAPAPRRATPGETRSPGPGTP